MRPVEVAQPKKAPLRGNSALLDANDAPVLDLNGAAAGTSTTAAYGVGDQLTRIAPAGTVMDPDSSDFNGGSLRVSFTKNGTATDQLAVITDATVTLTGNEQSALRQIKINGTLIGTLTGGQNGTDLVIALHSTATPELVQILLEHIGYANSSSAPSPLPRTVTFTLVDGDGTANGGHDTGVATATITYGSVNAAPVLTGDRAATVAEGGSYVITGADLSFSDPDDGAQGVTFTASELVHGMLKVNGVESNSFTGQQLADGLVTFEHDGSEIPAASFNVIVEDGNEDGSAPVASAFQFTVSAVNDAPFIACDLFADVAEGGSYTITPENLWFSDPDDGPSEVTFTVSNQMNGRIRVNGVVATSFTGQQLLDGLVAFEHDGSETAAASFDVSVEDGDEDGSAPVATAFTVSVSAVNDAPVLLGSLSAEVVKNGSHTLTAVELGFSDPDDLAPDVTFTVSDLVNGTVKVSGVVATSFTGQQLLDGLVKFSHDGSNTVTASFAVVVEDGDEDGSVPVPGTFAFTVKPADIDVTTLTASQGFIIQGNAAADQAGWSVSEAGDVNGDGFGDLIVGAPTASGGFGAGETYIVFGKASGFGTIDLTSLSLSTGLIIRGDGMFDQAGQSVSAAGDVNGDGVGDIIIGAPFGDDGGSNAGEAYVVFGRASGFGALVINLGALPASAGFIIQGDAADDWTGYTVSSAGDINGDGFDDLIVGAPNGDDGGTDAGEAYVVFGKASGFGTIDLTTLSASDGFIIQGDILLDHAGWSVSSAGDVNGDGLDDLIVGVPFGDDGGTDAGEAYVLFGKTTGFGVPTGGRQVLDLTGLAPSDGFVIQGDTGIDEAGIDVSSAGDVNGDGFDDLIVGAVLGDDGGANAGEAYVVFGKASGFGTIDLTSLTASQGFIIQGDAPADQAGSSVSAAGDVNGDGFGDLIVGAPFGDNGGTDAGEAYIVFGKASGFGTAVGSRQVIDLANLAFPDGFIVQGDAAGDHLGWSVSAAGDVNNDGFDDLIVGAPLGDNGGSNAGEAYVIFGSAFWGP